MCDLVYSFFCCKQNTAYEMRISDWSSDVCSSDLHCAPLDGVALVFNVPGAAQALRDALKISPDPRVKTNTGGDEDRKSVVYGKLVSVRVDLGGRRILKKKITL